MKLLKGFKKKKAAVRPLEGFKKRKDHALPILIRNKTRSMESTWNMRS